MKRQIIIIFALAAACSASISNVGGTTATSSSSGQTGVLLVSFSYTPTSIGDLIKVSITASAYSIGLPYCYGNSSFKTLFLGSFINGGNTTTGVTATSFYGYLGSSDTGVTCYFHTSGAATGRLEEFSGVLSVNDFLSGNTATGSGNSATLSVTTQDANDWVVCDLSDGTSTYSSLSGTSLQSSTSSPTGVMFYVTSSSPGSVTCSATLSGSSPLWVLTATELRTVANPLTWTPVQITPTGWPTINSQCPTGTGTNSNPTCTWQIAAMGSNNVEVVMLGDEYDGVSTQRSITNVQDCASLSSGVCGSSSNTWFIPAGGTVNTSGTSITQASGSFFATPWATTPWPNNTGSCVSSCTGSITINGVAYTIASVNSTTSITLTSSAGTQTGVTYTVGPGNGTSFGGTGSYSNNAALAYVLSSTSGANYLTVTRSGNVASETWSLSLFEVSPSSPAVVDSVNSQGDSFDALTHTMTPATVTGSCDFIVQGYTGGEYQSISSPYDMTAYYGHFAWATTNCYNSGTSPVWTTLLASDPAAGVVLALSQSQSAGSSPPLFVIQP